MKKAVALALALTLCVGVVYAQAADKFGYINLSRIFSEYPKTKDYDKLLTDKETAYTADVDKKAAEIKQFGDKFNLLSDKEKQAKKGELESKIKGFKDYKRQKEADLRKDLTDKKGEIIKDIETVIKQYSEKEGFTLVFNEVGAVYNAKSTDITDKVLEILNKGYKKQ